MITSDKQIRLYQDPLARDVAEGSRRCVVDDIVRHRTYTPGGSCNTPFSPMDKAETSRIQQLCAQIAEEQDREKFMDLVKELNRLLSAKEERLLHEDLNGKEG
jgi:hypothetical protein